MQMQHQAVSSNEPWKATTQKLVIQDFMNEEGFEVNLDDLERNRWTR